MKKKILLMSSLLLIGIGLAGCSNFDRGLKSFKSNWTGGLDREIIVQNQSGEIIYRDSGKFDIEVNDYRVKYIDEKNKLHIIYLGSSTAIINEK